MEELKEEREGERRDEGSFQAEGIKALKRMKNRKAAGPDDVQVEVWKGPGAMTVESLRKQFDVISHSEFMGRVVAATEG